MSLLSVYFQPFNAKLWSWKLPHGKRTPAILLKMFVHLFYQGIPKIFELVKELTERR